MKNITIAIPKGRLEKEIISFFSNREIEISFVGRELVFSDKRNGIDFILVKNADLPIYVANGIAGLGVCGEDVLLESNYQVYKLFKFPFGSTKMCIAGIKGTALDSNEYKPIRIATKFPSFTRNYFHSRGIPVEIIKLTGSIELAPLLGLTRFIVDLVQTGRTLKENNLEIIDILKEINVYLISNPAYYKLNYSKVDALIARLNGDN